MADRRVQVVRVPEIDLVFAVKFSRVPVRQSLHLGGHDVVGHRLDGQQSLTGRVSEHAHHRTASPRQRAERGSRQGIDQADALSSGNSAAT